MGPVFLYALASVFIVSTISFIGIITLSIKESKLKNVLIYFVSFSAGALFGDAFIHLLPEAVENNGSFSLLISIYLLSGIVFFFIIEKIVHWNHCHIPITKTHVHPFSVMNLVGDGVHNFIDGLVIGVSYIISIPVGFATTLAVVFHEIPQEIGDFGVLVHGGFSKNKALMVNFITGLTAVVGTIIALLIGSNAENIMLFLIPFAAGGFIYIAGSDLIPELHNCGYDLKKSFWQLIMFILGILIMAGLLIFG